MSGDQMYIDYAGDKLEIVDEVAGEVRCVEVFVAILPVATIPTARPSGLRRRKT